ncbi:MAG: radical SAM protein [Planctomycetes bacterium]|nr:radical SAM protein [Planctomycetota bacterium]
MRGAALLLLNPASPSGSLVNREGMGGLGLVVPTDGFVYPALSLAEMQGALVAMGASVHAVDLTLQPKRTLPLGHDFVVVRVALAAFVHDLREAGAVQRAEPAAQLALFGTSLGVRRAEIAKLLPTARVIEAPSGYDAATQLAGIAPFDAETAPDADWTGLPLGKRRWLPLHHNRGCTHECAWCPYTLATGRRLLRRSPARTAQEFAALVALHQPRRVVFRDPLFGADETDALVLLSRIAALKREQRAPIEVETRPECVTAALAQALRRASCVELKLGIESLEAGVLEGQRRLVPGRSAADYRESVRAALMYLDDAGVAVRCYLLRGLPGATARGDAESAAAFADRADLVVKQYTDPQALMMTPG